MKKNIVKKKLGILKYLTVKVFEIVFLESSVLAGISDHSEVTKRNRIFHFILMN